MATSGSFNGNSVTVGRGYGGNYVWTQWQLASQNTSGNYSTINWQTYYHFNDDDSELVNGSTSANVGTLWSSGEPHAYGGIFAVRDLELASGSFNIGADGGGNTTLSMSSACQLYGGSNSSGSGSWSLPTINRYANITGFNINDVSDEWIEFAWAADQSCDYISWWSNEYDGGVHHDTPASGAGWWTIDLHNLKSNTTYDITVAIRNAASGLWTDSGTQYPTTANQNNFVRGRVL